MRKIIQKTLRGMLIVPALALTIGFAIPAVGVAASEDADGLTMGGGASSAKSEEQNESLFGDEGIFQIVTNVLLFLIGAVSVIMLIVGGIRYTISQGDSAAVTSAKNTILYAVVGIVVALLAYAVVNFVITQFATSNP